MFLSSLAVCLLWLLKESRHRTYSSLNSPFLSFSSHFSHRILESVPEHTEMTVLIFEYQITDICKFCSLFLLDSVRQRAEELMTTCIMIITSCVSSTVIIVSLSTICRRAHRDTCWCKETATKPSCSIRIKASHVSDQTTLYSQLLSALRSMKIFAKLKANKGRKLKFTSISITLLCCSSGTE